MTDQTTALPPRIYQHSARKEWGRAVLVLEQADRLTFLFEDGTERRFHVDYIDRMQAINMANAEAAAKQDAVAYIRTNLEFHRTLYLRAQAPAMLAVAETVWLQLGPTMRALYARLHRPNPPQHHRMIIAALKAGDEPALRLAVRTDVTQGLRHLVG